MRTAALIPARLASTRLPGKPLVDIAGRPMIARVVERVLASGAADVVCVATDTEEIAAAARQAGAQAVLTDPSLPSGTDRVAQAVRALDVDLVLNVQGDEPLIDPEAVRALRRTLETAVARGLGLATLARPLLPEEASLPQVVKVVLAEDSTALYFSRSPIPFPRDPHAIPMLAHVGLYGYTKAALATVAALAPTRLEQAEGLEQLRFLGHGHRLLVAPGPWRSQAVDTPEDLARVRELFLRAPSDNSGA